MNASQESYRSAAISEEGSTWRVSDDVTNSTSGNAVVPSSVQLINGLVAVVWYIVPPLLLLLGSFGNVMIVVLMRGMRASPSTACLFLYFTALAVSDQVQLVTAVVYIWVYRVLSWPPWLYSFSILCFVPKFLWNMTSFTSAWFLVAMTYQRVAAVVAPHRVGVLCTVRRGKVVVATIVVLGCALHGQFFFTWIYLPEAGRCFYISKYRHVVEICEWLDLTFFSVFPFIFLVCGNSILMRQVVKSVRFSRTMKTSADQQEKQGGGQVHSMTMTMILTSVTFLTLTLPICIYGLSLQLIMVDASDVYFRAMKSLIYTCVAFMWMSSCATNFYLYLLSGKKFREETKKYLCWHQPDMQREQRDGIKPTQ